MTARTWAWLAYSIGGMCLLYILLRVTPAVWARVAPPEHATVITSGHRFIGILCRLPRDGEVLRISVRKGINGMDASCVIRREQ